MRSFLIELAQVGGKIARQHFRTSRDHGLQTTAKGRNDYVTFVDTRIEDVLRTRILSQYPDDLVLGEETYAAQTEVAAHNGASWIIDPIDGTTNFMRGIPQFAISIAYCDHNFEPRYAVVYNPITDEMFYAERNAGTWLNNERIYTSECTQMERALVACAPSFRSMEASADVFAVIQNMQPRIDDMRRLGASSLDLAYLAIGRCDAYWELGIWAWDTAAGELLVRGAGGVVTDFHGDTGNLLTRRSIVAAASPQLYDEMYAACAPLRPYLERAPYNQHVLATPTAE